jgi:hypothetical protein
MNDITPQILHKARNPAAISPKILNITSYALEILDAKQKRRAFARRLGL